MRAGLLHLIFLLAAFFAISSDHSDKKLIHKDNSSCQSVTFKIITCTFPEIRFYKDKNFHEFPVESSGPDKTLLNCASIRQDISNNSMIAYLEKNMSSIPIKLRLFRLHYHSMAKADDHNLS
jgi:hypothetical protein